MTSRSREAFTVPMWGSTGPECFAHWVAACFNCLRTARGSSVRSVSVSIASEASSEPSPQLTGEDLPTPRGSKETTS